MKPIAWIGIAAGGIAGIVGVATLRAPCPAPLSVYDKPVAFFNEEEQAIRIGHSPAGVSSLSAEACGACHKAEYAEWKASAHSRSVTEPVFEAAFKAEPRFLCRSCHSPLIEQHPTMVSRLTRPPKVLLQGRRPGGIDPAKNFVTEPNPKYDAALASEGVTCVTCHVRDETILTSKTVTSGRAPHPLIHSAQLRQAEFCGGCHQFDVKNPSVHPFEPQPGSPHGKRGHFALATGIQPAPRLVPMGAGRFAFDAGALDKEEPPVPPQPGLDDQYQMEPRLQNTVDEFHISPAAKRGETCQSCHMPTEGQRSRHNWPGRNADDMLKKAVALTVQLDKPAYESGDTLQGVIRLRNDAGHRFPTGDSLHAGIVDVWLRDGDRTLGRDVFVMTNQRSGPQVFFNTSMNGRAVQSDFIAGDIVGGRLGGNDPEGGSLESPNRPDTRLLPGEDAMLVYRQKVTATLAAAKNPVLRVRVFHSAVHPGFKGSKIDPKQSTQRLIHEELVPVPLRSERKPAASARAMGPERRSEARGI